MAEAVTQGLGFEHTDQGVTSHIWLWILNSQTD